jgi:DNA-binding CsgD family transcriptional regulator
MVELAQGEWAAARSRFEEAQSVMSALEDRRGVAKMITPQGDAALGQGDHTTAFALYQDALTILKDLNDKWWTAWCLEGMAGVAATQMQSEQAARLFGAVAVLRDAIRAPRPPAFLALRERHLVAARDRLGDEVFEAAWAEGRAMSPEQAIEYALSEVEGEPASAPATKTTSEPSVSSYPAGLSAREAEVLKLVAQGLTNAKIAEGLFISPRTVDRHLNSVYQKTGVSSRAAATRFAIEHGLA